MLSERWRRAPPRQGRAGEGEAAALGLPRDLVGGALAPGPPAAEAAQPVVDEARVDLAELAVADAPPVEGAGPVVLEHDVALSRQAPHDLLALALVEVHRDEVLVVVGAEE